MLIEGVYVPESAHEPGRWPFTVPAVRHVARHGLRFTSPITVLMGGNGTGKSTLLEAIAESYGLDVRGGHGGRRYGSTLGRSVLGEALKLHRTGVGSGFTRRNAKGFFLRAETAHGMLEYMTGMGMPGYGDRPAAEVSHGESYLQAVFGRFTEPGLYLLDEAEGPLSFESTLSLAYRLVDLVRRGDAQVVYSTHSPVIAAIPGAQVLQLDEDGVAEVEWERLELVGLWRRFLDAPGRFFDEG